MPKSSDQLPDKALMTSRLSDCIVALLYLLMSRISSPWRIPYNSASKGEQCPQKTVEVEDPIALMVLNHTTNRRIAR